MENHINPDRNPEGKRGIFFSSGIIITMALMLLAFEWGKSDIRLDIPLDPESLGDPLEEIIIATKTPEQEQPKPQTSFNIIIVPDDHKDIDWTPEPAEIGALDRLPTFIPPLKKEDPVDDPISTLFIPLENWPAFPGGEEAMMAFMAENIKYPRMALVNQIEGTVYVGFVVEKDGSVTNVSIMRDIGGGCGDEAARVVSMMPRWNPALQRNRPVRVRMNIPVAFRIASM